MNKWQMVPQPVLHPPLRPLRARGNARAFKETGWDTPTVPMLFVKPESALAGPNDPIVYPKLGKVIHYEAELVAVIGRTARRVSEADAHDYVLGYTCGNDVSDRLIQKEEMRFGCLFAGKAFDTLAPLGPVISTGLNPGNLEIVGRLNGEVKQRGNTSDLLFSVPRHQALCKASTVRYSCITRGH